MNFSPKVLIFSLNSWHRSRWCEVCSSTGLQHHHKFILSHFKNFIKSLEWLTTLWTARPGLRGLIWFSMRFSRSRVSWSNKYYSAVWDNHRAEACFRIALGLFFLWSYMLRSRLWGQQPGRQFSLSIMTLLSSKTENYSGYRRARWFSGPTPHWKRGFGVATAIANWAKKEIVITPSKKMISTMEDMFLQWCVSKRMAKLEIFLVMKFFALPATIFGWGRIFYWTLRITR